MHPEIARDLVAQRQAELQRRAELGRQRRLAHQARPAYRSPSTRRGWWPARWRWVQRPSPEAKPGVFPEGLLGDVTHRRRPIQQDGDLLAHRSPQAPQRAHVRRPAAGARPTKNTRPGPGSATPTGEGSEKQGRCRADTIRSLSRGGRRAGGAGPGAGPGARTW